MELVVGFHGVPEGTSLASLVPKHCSRKQRDGRHLFEIGAFTCIISLHILPHLYFIGEETGAEPYSKYPTVTQVVTNGDET